MAQKAGNETTVRESIRRSLGQLVTDWAVFAATILNPVILVLILSTVGLLYYRLTIPAGSNVPPFMDAIITIMISIFSGLAGGLIATRWSKFSESSILVTRGKSAIRGLDLLLNSVSTMERRTKTYSQNLDLENKESKSILTSYEEIIVRCNSLKEEAINAIEEWQDIIPEVANLKTKIGILHQLEEERLQLTQTISATQLDLNTEKEKSKDEKARLTQQLDDKGKELVEVTKKLREQQSRLSPGVVLSSGSLPSGSYLSGGGFAEQTLSGGYILNPPSTGPVPLGHVKSVTCSNCGKSYIPGLGVTITDVGKVLTSQKSPCPHCGQEN